MKHISEDQIRRVGSQWASVALRSRSASHTSKRLVAAQRTLVDIPPLLPPSLARSLARSLPRSLSL